MPFNLITSNYLENLADRLAEVVAAPLPSPLEREIILVQSKGMERWISMRLAEKLGVWANAWFPFPNAFVHEMFRRLLPEYQSTAENPYEQGRLAWYIMRHLPGLCDRPDFADIRRYLDKDASAIRRYQLSCHCARLFDQYLAYRPEMIVEWESNAGVTDGDARWQAALWNAVQSDIGVDHAARLHHAFLAHLERGMVDRSLLPARISVFGIPSLPDFHLSILAALGRYTEVNLFLFTPSRELWDYIASSREKNRLLIGRYDAAMPEEELHLESGNSLLASLGGLGRDFCARLHAGIADEQGCYADPPATTMLGRIQADILDLIDRGATAEDPRVAIDASDTSLRIHSCHTPLREIEVLHDNLLAMFERMPDLMPRDILVMSPDIETYAPFIQAVFDNPGSEATRIPYAVADRSMRVKNACAAAFSNILHLPDGRLESSTVTGLLDSPAVAQRLGLDAQDIEAARRWIHESGIRWGADAEHRRSLDLPAFGENSWRSGLDRLLMGYAMPGNNKALFGDILPYDELEGSDGRILGALVDFADRIFAFRQQSEQEQTLAGWSRTLLQLLDGCLSAEGEEQEFGAIRSAIMDLEKIQRTTGFVDRASFQIVRTHLDEALNRVWAGDHGFLSGGVTFCAMVPMRSIPFKVICLLGMNDDAFPRSERVRGFDLMARAPRPGDRSMRADDRYLFLEALLCARAAFHISYVGQSVRDNAEKPPSVAVSELIDYCEQAFMPSGDADTAVAAHIVIKHRLQAFHPAYFSHGNDRGATLFSYSADDCAAAQQAGKDIAPPLLFDAPLARPPQEFKTVDIGLLADFISAPQRFLLRRRLGIVIDDRPCNTEDTEPFALEGLDRYELGQELLDRRLRGADAKALHDVARGKGILPCAGAGESQFAALLGDVDGFIRRLQTHDLLQQQEGTAIDLQIDDFHIQGRIPDFGVHGIRMYRFASIKPKDRLQAWIMHCAFSASDVPKTVGETLLAGKDAVLHYAPIGNAREVLSGLLQLYWQGLCAPLKFFPRSSHAYAEIMMRKNDPKQAMKAAYTQWLSSDFRKQPGEEDDPDIRCCFRGIIPLDDDFAHNTMTVFNPLLATEQEIAL